MRESHPHNYCGCASQMLHIFMEGEENVKNDGKENDKGEFDRPNSLVCQANLLGSVIGQSVIHFCLSKATSII